MSSQLQNQLNPRSSDFNLSDAKMQNTFYYQIANMKAMKIVVLIKISKLPYLLEEMVENTQPFYLKTQKGELHREYQIINYIITESKDLSRQDQRLNFHENFKDSAVSHQSQAESQHENNQNQEVEIVNICGQDIFVFSKMNESLFQLRCNLFPLLEQFYKYLLGHEKIKKVKYQSLINKIKSEIAKLDTHINEHSDVYASQNSFLNIIIACELFMGCKFVFQEKFRKSKYSLFNKYEKFSKRPQFEQIYGKTTLCLKQYVPPEFEIEEQKANLEQVKRNNEVIPQEIIKISESIFAPPIFQNDRNELLYNYFRSVFTQNQNKKNYFPYFWLMYDSLSCNLIEIIYENPKNASFEQLISKIKVLQIQLGKYLKISTLDYGLISVYKNEKDNHYMARGLLCLGSKNFTDLKNDMDSSVELRQLKIKKIDVNEEQQKRQVQNLWQSTIENNNFEGLATCSIIYI